MGEYAMYHGHRIKIGTCEDLYYLRAGQLDQLDPERVPGSLNPRRADVQRVIRFRFPWPDEDHIAPGEFDAFDRAVPIPGAGVEIPESVEHHAVQFSAPAGYLLSVPCPEGPTAPHGLPIHRNGFPGRVALVQQGWRGGVLAAICQCGGCGARYNVPTLAEARSLIDACRAQAGNRRVSFSPEWWTAVADRLEAGYQGRGDEAGAPARVTTDRCRSNGCRDCR